MTRKPEPMLWLSDARGIYIPRDFANSFKDRDKHVTGIDAEAWAILEAGPDHELYWDAWTDVENGAVITNDDGVKFRIYNDGDCWLIPDEMEWDDETGFFVWPEDEPDPDRKHDAERNGD